MSMPLTFRRLPENLSDRFDRFETGTLFDFAKEGKEEHPYYNAYDHILNDLARRSKVTTSDSSQVVAFSVYPQAKLAGGLSVSKVLDSDSDPTSDHVDEDSDVESVNDPYDNHDSDHDDDSSSDYAPSEAFSITDVQRASPRPSRNRKQSKPIHPIVPINNKEPKPPKRYPDFIIRANAYEKVRVVPHRSRGTSHETSGGGAPQEGTSSLDTSPPQSEVGSENVRDLSKSSRAWQWKRKGGGIHSIWEIKYVRKLARHTLTAESAIEAVHVTFANVRVLRQVVGHLICGFREFPNQRRITLYLAGDRYYKPIFFNRGEIPDDLTIEDLENMKRKQLFDILTTFTPENGIETRPVPLLINRQDLQLDPETAEQDAQITGARNESGSPDNARDLCHWMNRLSVASHARHANEIGTATDSDGYDSAEEMEPEELQELVLDPTFEGENGSWTKVTRNVVDDLLS